MPIFGELPSLPVGACRYVMASNGLFVQARTHGMTVCLKYAELPGGVPYGQLEENVYFSAGLLPAPMMSRIRSLAANDCPNEMACLVTFDPHSGTYDLIAAQFAEASPGAITYSDAGTEQDTVVFDIHSHGTGEAFFSATDDESDINQASSLVQCSVVLGRCDSPKMQAKSRICVAGFLYELDWNPWHE